MSAVTVVAVLVLGGGLAFVALDAFSAVLTKKLGISYGWIVPVSVLAYLVFGYYGTRWTDLAIATASASGAAFIDGTLGSWVAWQLGVMPLPREQLKPLLGCTVPAGMVLMPLIAYVGGRWSLAAAAASAGAGIP